MKSLILITITIIFLSIANKSFARSQPEDCSSGCLYSRDYDYLSSKKANPDGELNGWKTKYT